jgi:DNA-binding XRE family transcriptional regulator
MPKKTIPRISAVRASKKAKTLELTWSNGLVTPVNVSSLIKTFKIFEPLSKNTGLFAKVQLGDLGTDVIWNSDIDISADTLWRLAQEQLGITMSPEAFKSWRVKNDYTLASAADALGLSRRMVAYYENGAKPVPKVVALATKALG